MYYLTVLELFRKLACGFKKSAQYSQDVNANGKPTGFFGPMDFVALKVEE